MWNLRLSKCWTPSPISPQPVWPMNWDDGSWSPTTTGGPQLLHLFFYMAAAKLSTHARVHLPFSCTELLTIILMLHMHWFSNKFWISFQFLQDCIYNSQHGYKHNVEWLQLVFPHSHGSRLNCFRILLDTSPSELGIVILSTKWLCTVSKIPRMKIKNWEMDLRLGYYSVEVSLSFKKVVQTITLGYFSPSHCTQKIHAECNKYCYSYVARSSGVFPPERDTAFSSTPIFITV